MTSQHRIHILFIPVLIALLIVVGLLGVLRPPTHAASLDPTEQPDPAATSSTI